MNKKMLLNEVMACNHCQTAMVVLHLAISRSEPAMAEMLSKLEVLSRQFVGSHYEIDGIVKAWDGIKEQMHDVDWSNPNQVFLAFDAADEAIQTLLDVHVCG